MSTYIFPDITNKYGGLSTEYELHIDCLTSCQLPHLGHTVSVIFLVVWMTSYVLDHIHDEGAVYQDQLYLSMGEVNHLLAMQVTFIMLPITVILPPLFIRRNRT